MSQATASLLFELGTEELPPGALDSLSDALASGIVDGLDQAGIGHGRVRALGAPRRLAVHIEGVAITQPDRAFERRGPAVAVAFDEHNNPTKAAEGFARSNQVSVEALERLETSEGAWLVYRGVDTGQATADLLPAIIQRALDALPIPKRMRWGDQSTEFVRPVHWVVALMDDAVVPMEIFGVASDRQSRGHRFHHPDPVVIARADDYEQALYRAHVVVDRHERREQIREAVRGEGERLGGRAVMDDDLLDEVTALVEWPVVLSGSFDETFLRVPPEALISSMQGHQRYFPVRDADGQLLARFITIANIESRDPARVIAGNERVIRPRLADAAFFWDLDRKKPLSDRLDGLEQVIFQKSLGSLADKSRRVAGIARAYAERFDTDPDTAAHAATLSRADLLTEMVGEFPELQGVMGRYYAREQNESPLVADALDEIYRPRFSGDAIAGSPLGQLLAVAERADTLMGIFAIGKAPTGAKDPFALRRAAVGLIRTLIEGQHAINLAGLLGEAAAWQPETLDAEGHVDEVVGFCLDRMRAMALEADYAPELFEAVRSALAPTDIEPLDFQRRLEACKAFASLSAAGSLAAANKRIRNILRKAGNTGDAPVDPALLREPAERDLHEAVQSHAGPVQDLIERSAYTEALAHLAELRAPVDRFFDDVMVMADDDSVRHNRLALLGALQSLFLAIADVSALPEPG